MTNPLRLAGVVVIVAVSGCAGPLSSGGGPSTGSQNDIISPPLMSIACLGVDRGTAILSGPGGASIMLGYTGNQVASDGYVYEGYARILFRESQSGWVLASATHPFARPGFPSVRCQVAGIRPDGSPVFLYR